MPESGGRRRHSRPAILKGAGHSVKGGGNDSGGEVHLTGCHGMKGERDHDLDRPIRVIFKALYRREVTPEEAEEVITDLGWRDWG